jgi:hypothetical protein
MQKEDGMPSKYEPEILPLENRAVCNDLHEATVETQRYGLCVFWPNWVGNMECDIYTYWFSQRIL